MLCTVIFITSTQIAQAAIIFYDDFENQNYNAWTGVVENSGSTMDFSGYLTFFDGIYAARCALNYSWRTYAFAYYNSACLYSVKNNRRKALKHLGKAIDEGFGDINLSKKQSKTSLKNISGTQEYKRLIKRIEN